MPWWIRTFVLSNNASKWNASVIAICNQLWQYHEPWISHNFKIISGLLRHCLLQVFKLIFIHFIYFDYPFYIEWQLCWNGWIQFWFKCYKTLKCLPLNYTHCFCLREGHTQLLFFNLHEKIRSHPIQLNRCWIQLCMPLLSMR